jgi:hypothetical protein
MAETLTKEQARAALDDPLKSIGVAREIIRAVEPTLARFMVEARRMESVGPILDPTLFNSSERRATEAMVKPFFEMALAFVERHDRQMETVKAALEKVQRT